MYFTGGIVTKFVLISKLGIMDSMWALILPRAVNVFNLIIARTFFMSTVPDELLDSSRIDGATNTQFFIQCVLPLSKAIIAIMLLRHAIFYWNDYFDGYMFIYTTSKNTLQLTLQQILIANQVIDMESMEQLDAAMDRAALAALIKYCIIFVSAAPMLILYPFLQKYFVQGMLIGAVKG
jgi:putative aldouronate transport system permease protein